MEGALINIVENGGGVAVLALLFAVATLWIYNRLKALEQRVDLAEKELDAGKDRFEKTDAKIDGVKESIDKFSGKFDMYMIMVKKQGGFADDK